jgi:hypothetical protein
VSSHSGTGLAEVIADPNSRREETPIIPEDYIDKYNLVIRQYNNDINRIGYVYLSELPLHSSKFKWAFFLCLFFFQPALFVLIPIAIVHLIKERRIIQRNIRFVPNVFENMLHVPHHFIHFNCAFKYWDCKIEMSRGREVIYLGTKEIDISSSKLLQKKRIESLQRIRVMTFDEVFRNWYYHALTSNRNRIIALSVLLGFLVVICIVLTTALCLLLK